MSNPNPPYSFEEGNQLWRLRSRDGRKKKYETPDDLRAACIAYFDWANQNPLYEEKLFAGKGEVISGIAAKMRAFTQRGLQLHMGIDRETWTNYKNEYGDGYKEVCEWAEDIIYEQKFTGAAADLLNANIIGRELGLADKREVTGKDGEPINLISRNMTPQEAAEAYAATLNDEQG